MKTKHLIILSALVTLLLAGCGGTSPTSVPPTSAPATVAATTNPDQGAQTPPATKESAGSSATAAATQSASGTKVGALPTFAASDPGSDISVDPKAGTAVATPNLAGTPDNSKPIVGNPINGTAAATSAPVPNPPKLTPPPTLEELIKQFPDLAPYVNSATTIDNMDMSDLYKKMVEIYTKSGASGLAVFLKDSGLLEKLNLPVGYLDLLMVYDKGGLPAVQKLAKDRGYLNSKNEVVGTLTPNTPDDVTQIIADMTKLGVTTYPPLDTNGELQIGIPLDVLSTYQTPGTLINYLVKVANVKNVKAVHPPLNRAPAGILDAKTVAFLKGQGPKYVGADAWHKAGITGKGVKVGILDMGFGGIKALMNGTDLPTDLQASRDLDELDAQEENHGTACAEVVHGMAPDAQLFIGFFDDNASWEEAVTFLLDNNVDIISYSVGSAVGPRDGTFGESLVVDQIVEKTGVLWINAAGNEAVDHTMFKYTDADKDGANDFDGKDQVLPFIAFDPNTSVTMNWNGNWKGGEKNEYTFSIFDKDGNEVASAAEPIKGRKNDFPVQFVNFAATPEEVYYMVVRKSPKAKGDAILDIFINNGLLPEGMRVADHSITVPADSDSVLTVGATGLTNDKLEFYSSQGPTMDGRMKPDITAPTGEKVTGHPDGFNGTSGATPLISGAAALAKQVYPDLTMAEIKAYLEKNVKDLGKKGPDSVFGFGRVKLADASKISADQGPDNSTTPEPSDATPAPDDEPTKVPPTKAPKGGAPSASITDSSVKFNVTVKGTKGVQINVSFDIDNYKGKKGLIGLIINGDDGKAKIKPKTNNYNVGGTLGTALTFTPKFDSSSYSDVPLFLPNSEFASLPSGKNELTYTVVILDASDPDNLALLAKTDPTPITVTKK